MGIKISLLPNAGALSGTDLFPVSQGSATNKVSWSSVLAALLVASEGSVVSSGNYTAVPPTTSTISFSNTSTLAVGMPLRIVQDAITKYYVITSITTNTSITVSGPPLTGAVAITEISILDRNRVVQVDLLCSGGYDLLGSTTGLYLRSTRSRLRWLQQTARLVQASFSHDTPGTGTLPNVNVSINGTNVFTDNSNAGALLPNGTSWISIGAGTAALANYTISYGQAFELNLTAGANLDSRDLTASLIFVLG